MTLRQNLRFALTGWVAGVILTLGVGLIVFPAIFGDTRAPDAWPDLLILAIVLLLISPAALAGGLIGGRIPREGGSGSQMLMAVILGVLMTVPFSCLGFWYIGW